MTNLSARAKFLRTVFEHNEQISFITKISLLSLKHKRYSNKAIFLSYKWHLKKVSGETPNLKWSVLRCVPPYSNILKKWVLRLCEKLEMINYQN